MLPAFVIGAALAIWRIDLRSTDKLLPVIAPLFLLSCLLQYYYPSSGGSIYVAALGAMTIWQTTGFLERTGRITGIANAAKFAFPIYLMHGVILVVALSLGVSVTPTVYGLLLWLLLPAAIAVTCCLVFVVMRQLVPSAVQIATGGRGA
ncbi:hypothetical protein Sa4125_24920 [Aureimonas sp. SA4125]|nr:hypothetical protein Sa4125_24920 [Aureimonas sp. SA4125]